MTRSALDSLLNGWRDADEPSSGSAAAESTGGAGAIESTAADAVADSGAADRDDAPPVAESPATPAPRAADDAPPELAEDDGAPADDASGPADDVGEWLMAEGVVDAAQLTQARKVQKQTPGRRLGDILIDMGVDEAAVQRANAELAGLPFERIDPQSVSERYLHKLGLEYCKNNGIVPLRESGTRIVVGVVEPQNLFMLDEVRQKLGRPVKVVMVTATEETEADVVVDDIIADIGEDDVEVVEDDEEDVDLEKQAGQSPVIRFVNYLIYDAAKNGASDIHIEPQEKRLRIRYRIDGILFEAMNPPHGMHAAIVSRLKIMANLDISERRLPQDGRIRAVVHGRKLDLRLSTLPTGQGEKAVMRILDGRSIKVTLDQLGMPEDTLTIWQHHISQPHGIILVTGPTGSGKSTTLYASLGQMDRNKLNISTVEDPIEYHLDAINQVQVHEKIGMGFSAALRSLLRQDPDVIMLGEIRDGETSKIAVQAALTGHLVLSTLHTNDAPSSITRLLNIGVEPFLIGAAVNAVLAQRLVRKICGECKEQVTPDASLAEHLEMQGISTDTVWQGKGCSKCHNTGYSGRLGLYEMLTLDDTLRDAIARRPNVTEFRRLCVERGMKTLRADGFEKVAQGITSIEEVLRVTHSTI